MAKKWSTEKVKEYLKSFDSIEWSNGVDVDPETLYQDSYPYL